MARSVTALVPRVRPFEVAVDAFRRGELRACLGALHGRDDVRAKTLSARALGRLGSFDDSLVALASVDENELSFAERAEVELLRAFAHIQRGAFDDARAALDLGRVYAFGTPVAALEAEFHVFDGAWSFAVGDLAAAERAATAAIACSPSVTERLFERPRVARTISLEHVTARAHHLVAVIAARREAYAEHATCVSRALVALEGAPAADLWLRAGFLMNEAFLVRDFDDLASDDRLRDEPIARWPADLAPMRFEIDRSLGWANALRGDHLGAFRDFRRARDGAPSPAHAMRASTDWAFLRRELGEPLSAREELEHCADVAERIAWDDLGQERVGLMFLAREVATFDATRGAALLARYRRIRSALPRTSLNVTDRRLVAHERFSEAVVARATGDETFAARGFVDAFEIWSSLGCRWLAATAALELFEANDAERFRTYARREGAARPASWLALANDRRTR